MGLSLSNILIGGLQAIAGIFLLATGVGGGIGAKLLLSGGLTLISSLMSARTGRKGLSSSPTYGWDSLGNAAYEGSPFPVVYGEHVVRPGIISLNVVSDGDKQILKLLCLVSEGEIDSMRDVRLNDVPIASFAGATAVLDRTGTSTQTVIPGFNETGIQYPAGTSLIAGASTPAVHIHEMKATGDTLVLPLVWPAFYAVSSKGADIQSWWACTIQYKLYTDPDTAYKTLGAATDDAAAGWTLSGTKAGTWYTPGYSRATVRKQIRLRFDGQSGRPPRGRYTVKITADATQPDRTTNTPTLSAVIEVTNDQRAYAGMAVLALSIPASEQLNGIPEVSLIVKGRKVYDPRTGLTAWSQNPVLCALDLMTNSTYGLGLSLSKFDVAAAGNVRNMADACDATITPKGGGSAEAKWQLDYVLDVASPAVDHLTQMLAGCRMTLVYADRLVSFVQDAAASVTTAFDARQAGNSWTDSGAGVVRDTGDGADRRSTLVAKSLDYSQRWTRVRVQYVDRNRSWQQRVTEVFDTYANIGAITGGPFTAGEAIRFNTSKALGYLTHGYATGSAFITYTQADGATAPASGETVEGLSSHATAVLSSAPYTASPERTLDIQLYGVTRRSQALREARYALNNARSRTLFASWGGWLGDLNLIPGDRVTMSSDLPAWSAKGFTILSCGFDGDGLSTFEARVYDADVFSDNVDTSQVDALQFVPGGAVPPGLRFPDPAVPSSPGSSSNVVQTPGASTVLGSAGTPAASASVGTPSFVNP